MWLLQACSRVRNTRVGKNTYSVKPNELIPRWKTKILSGVMMIVAAKLG